MTPLLFLGHMVVGPTAGYVMQDNKSVVVRHP